MLLWEQSRPSVALVIFFGLESYIEKIPFLFLPYKAWANGVRVPLVWFFASRSSVALVIFFGLKSHIGKIPFLFLPYKAWANRVRVPLVLRQKLLPQLPCAVRYLNYNSPIRTEETLNNKNCQELLTCASLSSVIHFLEYIIAKVFRI